ncbi:unnamed protein product [Cuscuta campestris]|uniref:DEAD/DEAH-box helicase domain-containing protein n=1 Tax=Cuscuta campestris TaxID=132261 RepID=A0A484N5W4_9ASTE|nr:unnamed protein product [Cuscuta campestris]
MGKSNDSIAKRKNKKIRRKQNESSTVSERVAAIIAANKRRQSGKRRLCQSMCFSLPTLEDPFNDRNGKPDPLKIKKQLKSKKDKKIEKKRNAADKKNVQLENLRAELLGKAKNPENTAHQTTGNGILGDADEGDIFDKNEDCPSKFLMSCLNTIQNAVLHDGALNNEAGNPFVGSSWGTKFWNCFTSGKDIMDTNQSHSCVEQIAWIASTAADSISKKQKGLSLRNPFLLYLVPSQEKAVKVRQIFKPLKTLGIHTISLHSGASMDHQIQGLKSCDPQFLIATPERLQELISHNAIDISGVSLLVIEGLDYEACSIDAIKTIKHLISGRSQTVVFCDSSRSPYISAVEKFLQVSFCKIPYGA